MGTAECRLPVEWPEWCKLMACGGHRVTATAKPLSPALADGPYVRGQARDGSRPDGHAQDVRRCPGVTHDGRAPPTTFHQARWRRSVG